jgi:hypothetical protein
MKSIYLLRKSALRVDGVATHSIALYSEKEKKKLKRFSSLNCQLGKMCIVIYTLYSFSS